MREPKRSAIMKHPSEAHSLTEKTDDGEVNANSAATRAVSLEQGRQRCAKPSRSPQTRIDQRTPTVTSRQPEGYHRTITRVGSHEEREETGRVSYFTMRPDPVSSARGPTFHEPAVSNLRHSARVCLANCPTGGFGFPDVVWVTMQVVRPEPLRLPLPVRATRAIFVIQCESFLQVARATGECLCFERGEAISAALHESWV